MPEQESKAADGKPVAKKEQPAKEAAVAPEKAAQPPRAAAGDGDQPKAEARKADDPMRVLARRAVEIAEAGGASLGSAITAPQAQFISDNLPPKPTEAFAPATLDEFQAYAQGGRGVGRAELPPEALEKIRAFCKGAGNRRIWPRKVCAMVLAIEEKRTGKTRPGTQARPKPVAEKPAEKEPTAA